jgi:hypothetical protein
MTAAVESGRAPTWSREAPTKRPSWVSLPVPESGEAVETWDTVTGVLDQPIVRQEMPAKQWASLRWPRVGMAVAVCAAGVAFSLLLGEALRLPRRSGSMRSLTRYPREPGI